MLKFWYQIKRQAKTLAFWGGVSFTALFVLLMAVWFLLPRVYIAEASFYLQRELPGEASHEEGHFSPMRDHLRILESELVMERVVERMAHLFPNHEPIDVETLKDELHADTTISTSNATLQTRIIDISFRDEEPEYAARLLDEVIQAYEAAIVHIAKETHLTGLGLLKDRLAELMQHRHALGEELKVAYSQAGTIDVDIANGEYAHAASQIAQFLGSKEAALDATRQKVSEVESILGVSADEARSLANIREDATLDMWERHLANLETELSGLKGKYTDEHPEVQSRVSAIARVHRQIKERMELLYNESLSRHPQSFSKVDQELTRRLLDLTFEMKGLERERDQYAKSLADMESKTTKLGEQKSHIADLEFQQEALRKDELELRKHLQETDLIAKEMVEQPSTVVISPPTATDEPVFPLSLGKAVVLYAAVSGLLALLVAVVILFAQPVKHLQEMGVPILATIGKTTQNLYDEVLKAYQNLASLNSELTYQTIMVMDLLDPMDEADPRRLQFMPILGMYFARRQIQTLLVDCSGLPWQTDDIELLDASLERVASLQECDLFRFTQFPSLHLLKPVNGSTRFYDPYLLHSVPDLERFELVLIHRPPLQPNETEANLTQTADALVINTTHHPMALKRVGRLLKLKGLPLLGAMLFKGEERA